MKKKATSFLAGVVLGIGLFSIQFVPQAKAESEVLNYQAPLNSGQTISGTLEPGVEAVVYPFTTTESEEVFISIENVRGRVDVRLHDGEDQYLTNSVVQGDGTIMMHPLLKPGNYIVRVVRDYYEPDSSRAAFDLKVTFAAGAVKHDSNYEPNDISKYGYPLQTATPINSTLSSAADIDWYKIQSIEDGMVSVKLTKPSAAVSLSLHDEYGKQVDGAEIEEGSDGANLTAVVKSGTYYIRITSLNKYDKNFTKASYTLTSIFNAGPIAKDANHEPNDIPSYAQVLQSGIELRSTIADKLDVDWYRLDLKEDSDVYIAMSQIDGNMSVGIYDDLYYEKEEKETADLSNMGLQKKLRKGTYYVRVAPSDWEDRRISGSYTLKASFNAGTTPYDKLMEPNDILANAFPLLNQRTYTAELSHAADLDWYKVELSKAGKLITDISLDSGDAEFEVFNQNGTSMGGLETTDSEVSAYIDLNPGIYYIRVSSYGDRFKGSLYKIAVTYPNSNQIPVQVNGSRLTIKPTFIGEILYFPANQILPSYSAKATYDAKTKTVTIRKSGTVYKVGLSSKVVKVNGKKIQLDAAVVKVNGQILLPNSFFTKVFKSNITWDSNNQILITK